MTKPQLHIDTGIIDGNGDIVSNWISADINPNVNITIKDKIKDSKDVGKVFAAYTNQFKLPASKKNNKIFKRFANPNILEGFDPRKKYDALIKLNGSDFKKGYIKLNSVNLKNNLPESYNVQFFGEITSLKDLLGKTKLKDLSYLSLFSYANTHDNVMTGFEDGFNVELSSGVREQSYISITSSSLITGDFDVVLNGDTTSVPLDAHLTSQEVAVAIALEINLYAPNHSATVIQANNVLIYSNNVGNEIDTTINANSTGVSATVSTIAQGVAAGSSAVESIVTKSSDGDFKYPLISHTRGFEYDTDFQEMLTGDKINYTDLKPSMKIEKIFEAIESEFPSIRFNKDWLFGKNSGGNQLTSITITSAPTSAGLIELSINGQDYNVEVEIGTVNETAQAIADAANTIRGYVSFADQDVVHIASQDFGIEEDTEIDTLSVTGLAVSISTIQGFLSSTTSDASTLRDLYMWLHNKKGYIGYEDSSGNVERNELVRFLNDNGDGAERNNWEYVSGDGDLRKITQEGYFNGPTDYKQQSHFVELSISDINGDGDITVEIKAVDSNVNQVWRKVTKTFNASDVDKTTSLSLEFRNYETREYTLRVEITADSSINNYKPTLSIEKTTLVLDGGFPIPNQTSTTENANYALSTVPSEQTYTNLTVINPQKLMPDMKVIDFLSDLFKTYNLVAFEERLDDNSYLINIKSLDDYLDSGTQYDVTEYVDISSTTVSRVSPHKSIEYSFAEPKTFLAINQAEITGDDFGNMDFDVNNFTDVGNTSTNSLLFDGSDYKVENKFEKMMFERINKLTTGKPISNVQWGWFVDDNSGDNLPKATIGKPLLHYIVSRDLDGDEIIFDNLSAGIQTLDDYYNSPSNVDALSENTMHFNEEFDEWSRETNEHSIFNNFHSRYIKGIYSAYAKRLELSAKLPPIIFSKLNLNDTLVIDRVSYIIDSMDININKASTKLNLLRVTDETKVFEGTEEEKRNVSLTLTVTTPADNHEIFLPYDEKGNYDGVVDWGDGTETINASDSSNVYATAGTYTIEVKGNASIIDFTDHSDTRNRLQEISSWGQGEVKTLNLENTDNADYSNISNTPVFAKDASLYRCFARINNNDIDGIEDWDVSNVSNMEKMFNSNYDFNQSIGGWDVSNVTNMRDVFAGAFDFNKPIGNWDVSNVTNMFGMFQAATSFNQDINSWDVSNVTDMGLMFLGNNAFNQPIGDWDVSSVTNMGAMFSTNFTASRNCIFNQPIGDWDVGNVTDMSGMFLGNTAFDQPIGNWNVSNVSNFYRMFYATTFNQDISSWDVSNVTSFSGMFSFNTVFNQDISSWDTSNVTNMYGVFMSATSFNYDISGWDFSSVTNMDDFMDNKTYNSSYYDSLLIALDATGNTNVTLGMGSSQYGAAGTAARISLVSKGWTITDGGALPI